MLSLLLFALSALPQSGGWKTLTTKPLEGVSPKEVHPSAALRLMSERGLELPGSNQESLSALIEGRVEADEHGKLRVDIGGIGEDWKSLGEGPLVVDWFSGGRTQTLQFFPRGGYWWVCSAGGLEANKGEELLQLIDANADGDYLDAGDLVRFSDGLFRPIGHDQVISDGQSSWTFRLARKSAKTKLQWRPIEVEVDGALRVQMEALSELNHMRNAQGFPPADYSKELSAALMKHTEFLQRHDPQKTGTLSTYFGEDPTLELYTEEGDQVSRRGNVNYLTPGVDTRRHVRSLLEMTHSRENAFEPGRPAFGYGLTANWSFLAMRGGAPVRTASAWVLPGAGAQGLSAAGGRNWPFPKSYPSLYDEPRGLPLSITLPKTQLADASYLTVRSLALMESSGMREVGGFFFSIQEVLPGAPSATWYFVPAEPLAVTTEYIGQAVLERKRSVEGGPGVVMGEELIQWTFSTGK